MSRMRSAEGGDQADGPTEAGAIERGQPTETGTIRPGLAVVITGGTRGIGAGLAAAFLQAGSHVVICGRTPPTGAAALPTAGGRKPVFRQADVRDPDQANRLIAAAH